MDPVGSGKSSLLGCDGIYSRLLLLSLICSSRVCRFHHDDDAVATTDHVRISAATAFMPMMSSVDPTEFVFAYRIT